jgi:hypothetical protein
VNFILRLADKEIDYVFGVLPMPVGRGGSATGQHQVQIDEQQPQQVGRPSPVMPQNNTINMPNGSTRPSNEAAMQLMLTNMGTVLCRWPAARRALGGVLPPGLRVAFYHQRTAGFTLITTRPTCWACARRPKTRRPSTRPAQACWAATAARWHRNGRGRADRCFTGEISVEVGEAA